MDHFCIAPRRLSAFLAVLLLLTTPVLAQTDAATAARLKRADLAARRIEAAMNSICLGCLSHRSGWLKYLDNARTVSLARPELPDLFAPVPTPNVGRVTVQLAGPQASPPPRKWRRHRHGRRATVVRRRPKTLVQ